jgi:hypothetical protein
MWLQLSPCLKLLKLGLIPERICLWLQLSPYLKLELNLSNLELLKLGLIFLWLQLSSCLTTEA